MACILAGLVSSSVLSAATPSISAGLFHSLALKSDGTVWEWGIHYVNPVTGAQIPSLYAVQVSGLAGIVAVSENSSNSLALKSDGTVWMWGNTGTAPLGAIIQNPVQVSGLTGAIAISAGQNYGLALKSDGTVWAWGNGGQGNMGNGNIGGSLTAVKVDYLLNSVNFNFMAVSAGRSGNPYAPMSLALKHDGTVWAWGGVPHIGSPYGFGSPTLTSPLTVPAQLTAFTTVLAVSRGYDHSVILKNDGTAWAFGSNWSGQLGDGTTVDKTTSVTAVKGLANAVKISAGTDFTLALKSDGTVWAWGVNGNYQLGYVSAPVTAPQIPYSSLPSMISGLSTVTQISAGSAHALALKSDGTVWAWGSGSLPAVGLGSPFPNALGNGTTNSSSVPVQVLIGPGTPLKL